MYCTRVVRVTLGYAGSPHNVGMMGPVQATSGKPPLKGLGRLLQSPEWNKRVDRSVAGLANLSCDHGAGASGSIEWAAGKWDGDGNVILERPGVSWY